MISIIVPCYNCESTLRKTVESFLKQTVMNEKCSQIKVDKAPYQIVLVDDGSTDSTSIICDHYALQYKNMIKVIHQSNGGLMNAWKRGVIEADGEYIVFCDADDYVEEDLLERINDVIIQYQPDMITYGMVAEYNNGEKVQNTNLLKEGYYDISTIRKEILPYLCSNGAMQSELIAKSRWSKVFKRDLLNLIMPDLDENITTGEDDVTTFAAVMNTNSIYSMQNYYPYHYVRNTQSMIGSYDEKIFDKIKLTFENKFNLAERYGYPYKEQLYADWMSQYILFTKKEICRNPGNVREVQKRLKKIRESEQFENVLKHASIKKYKMSSRMFATLFIKKRYKLLILITRIWDQRRGRNV